ncbi:hypothetical protein PFISCL1PPCAC_5219, partial [Pristionchus fissidentatus]
NIQLELCKNSLAGYWETEVVVPHKELQSILRDSLLALVHLHAHNLVHLDIKEANILRTSRGLYKLCDFSVTADLTKQNKPDEFGDGKYAAPEVLKRQFTVKADIFSLGMTLAQV